MNKYEYIVYVDLAVLVMKRSDFMRYILWVILLAMSLAVKAQPVTKEEVKEAVRAAIRELKIDSHLAQFGTARTGERQALADTLLKVTRERHRPYVKKRWPFSLEWTLFYYVFYQSPFAQNQLQYPGWYVMDSTWVKLPIMPSNTVLKWSSEALPGDYIGLHHLTLPVFSPDKLHFLIVYEHIVKSGGEGTLTLFSRRDGQWKKTKLLRSWIYN